MVVCIQNSAFSTRIASLYGSQPLSAVFAFTTATFGSEFQVSMCPRFRLLIFECKTACLDPEWRLFIGPILHLMHSKQRRLFIGPILHLWFYAFKTATLASELLVSMGPSLHLWFCAFKTVTLASELIVSTGLIPYLWLLYAKQRLEGQNYKTLWVLTSPMVVCIQISAFSTRIASLYGSQPLSAVFACKTATFGSEFQVSMCPRFRLLIFECKTACLDPEWRLFIGPILHLWFYAFKTATLASELLVSMGPSLHLWFCAFKTSTLASELIVSTGLIPYLWLLYAKQRLEGQNYKSLWVPDVTYGFLHSKQRL